MIWSLRRSLVAATAVLIVLFAAAVWAANDATTAAGRSAGAAERAREALAIAELLSEAADSLVQNARVLEGSRRVPPQTTIGYAVDRKELAVRRYEHGRPLPPGDNAWREMARAIERARFSLERARSQAERAAALSDAEHAQRTVARVRKALDVVIAGEQAAYGRAVSRLRRVGAAVCGAGVFMVAVMLVSIRQIGRACATAGDAARTIAEGDFSCHAAEAGPVELRRVLSAFNAACDAVVDRDQWLKAALDQAQRQRDLASAVIDATSDGLLLYDRTFGRILLANRRCAELLGIELEALIDAPEASVRSAVQAISANPEEYERRLAVHLTSDGLHEDVLELTSPVQRVLRRTSSPLQIEGDGLAGRVVTYTDITAESTLDRVRSEFVATASHELRTPLTSVHGALQLVLAAGAAHLPDEDRELLAISLESTDRLVRIVNDLLDLSKIDRGRMPMRLVPCDAAAAVTHAVKGIRPLAVTRGIHVMAADVAPGLAVRADEDLLARVLTNLLGNAINYSPQGGRVVISAMVHDADVAFAVDDEGPGISRDDAAQLFKPFSRVGPQRYDRQTGTGLGLAISRAIVEQHGGRIWAEPRATACGSRFAFTLQRCEPADALSVGAA